MKTIYGVYVVLTTPFDGTGAINYEGMAKNVEWLASQGVQGVVALGSTGEFASLNDEQKRRVGRTVVDAADGKVPVLLGASAETTEKAIEYVAQAKDLGAAGALVIPPWYYLPTPEEIVYHYEKISDAVSLPIMVYNNPWTSKVDIQPETVAALSRLKNVTHIKESTGDVRRIAEIRTLTQDRMTVFCGWEDLAFESFAAGAKGWICVVGNFAPRLSVSLFQSMVERKDLDAGWTVYKRLLPALRHLERAGKMHQTVKYALDQLGLCGGDSTHPRLPLVEKEKEAIRRLLKDVE